VIIKPGPELGHVDDTHGDRRLRVRYFRLAPGDDLHLGPLPATTLERRWVVAGDLDSVRLAHESLRPILRAAFTPEAAGGSRAPS